jgi:hypothetical protein
MPDNDWGFAPPPFSPEQSLLQLQRAMRDCKLTARGRAFESRGKVVVEFEIQGAEIAAHLARRLVNTPEWDRYTVKSAAEQRKLIDEVKKRLARWTDEE